LDTRQCLYGQAKYDSAFSEYQKGIDADSSDLYARLYYFYALLRAGRMEEARRYLADLSDSHRDSLWISALIRFCDGQISVDALLGAAERADSMLVRTQQVCEAYYYAGMSYCLILGDGKHRDPGYGISAAVSGQMPGHESRGGIRVRLCQD